MCCSFRFQSNQTNTVLLDDDRLSGAGVFAQEEVEVLPQRLAQAHTPAAKNFGICGQRLSSRTSNAPPLLFRVVASMYLSYWAANVLFIQIPQVKKLTD